MKVLAMAVLGLGLGGSEGVGGAQRPAPAPVRLTLDEAVRLASTRSPRFGRLEALAQAAEEAVRETEAGRRPSLYVRAGYTRQSGVPELRLAAPGALERTIFPNIPDNFRARLEVSVPLYTGGRQWREEAAAEREGEAARAEVEAGSRDVVLETTAAYWRLVTARETARVLEEAIAAYDGHLADGRNLVSVGMASRSDLLAVEAERAHAELRALEARSAAEVAEEDLVRLLALGPGTAVEPMELLEDIVPSGESLDSLIAQALAARPERRALLARVASSRARAGAARAGTRPQLGLVAGYDYANPNRRILPAEPEWRSSWDAGVALSWTVFDGGKSRAAAARAAALERAAERELEEVERGIRYEVTERWVELETVRAAIEAAERGLASAEESRRVSADRYRQGLAPSSELLDAEVAQLRAGLERTRALAALRLARARLARAVSR